MKLIIISVVCFIFEVFVLANDGLKGQGIKVGCLVEGILGTCVPLTECTHIVSGLQDSVAAKDALSLTHRRKCGFDELNVKVCCFENETILDTKSRLGDGRKSPGSRIIAEDPLLGSYVEELDPPPICGRGYLPNDSSSCERRSKRNSNDDFLRSVYIIAGGRPIIIGVAPWMALVGYKPSASFWECGGSIITRRHILTAAHCINERLYLVRVGELDLAKDDDGAVPADYLVKKTIPHEEYDTKTHVNDIGILLLEEDIEFTDLIKPICLPNLEKPTDWPNVGDTAAIAGWGRVSHGGEQSSHLLYAEIDVFETSLCQHQYRNFTNAVIDNRIICAGDLAGIKDSCKGDSGGPLMVQSCHDNGGWHYTQAGVVSYGLECARAGYPGVYTRVAYYIPWIKEKTIGRQEK